MAEGLLIHADAVRSPDMYLATGAADTDPFSYIEVDGRRIVVTNVLEAPMLQGSPLLTDVWLDDDFDRRGLVAGGMASDQARYEVTRRALERAGVASALVPPDFPLALADYLRARGIEVRPARAEFELRRRCKDARALAGIRQAQRASEAAMRRCEELLASSTPAATGFVVDGEPLTCERLIGEIEHTLAAHGCEGEPPLVSAGPQVAFVHESGRGRSGPASRS